MSLVIQSYEIACAAHDGQVRKHSGLPYMVHPCRVASIVSELQSDVITSAAFLHDVVEDGEMGLVDHYSESIQKLDAQVFSIVNELTCDFSSDRSEEDYMLSFENCSHEAFLIKMADRVDNIYDFARCGKKDYAVKYANKAKCLLDFKKKYLERQSTDSDLIYAKRIKLLHNLSLPLYRAVNGVIY